MSLYEGTGFCSTLRKVARLLTSITNASRGMSSTTPARISLSRFRITPDTAVALTRVHPYLGLSDLVNNNGWIERELPGLNVMNATLLQTPHSDLPTYDVTSYDNDTASSVKCTAPVDIFDQISPTHGSRCSGFGLTTNHSVSLSPSGPHEQTTPAITRRPTSTKHVSIASRVRTLQLRSKLFDQSLLNQGVTSRDGHSPAATPDVDACNDITDFYESQTLDSPGSIASNHTSLLSNATGKVPAMTAKRTNQVSNRYYAPALVHGTGAPCVNYFRPAIMNGQQQLNPSSTRSDHFFCATSTRKSKSRRELPEESHTTQIYPNRGQASLIPIDLTARSLNRYSALATADFDDIDDPMQILSLTHTTSSTPTCVCIAGQTLTDSLNYSKIARGSCSTFNWSIYKYATLTVPRPLVSRSSCTMTILLSVITTCVVLYMLYGHILVNVHVCAFLAQSNTPHNWLQPQPLQDNISHDVAQIWILTSTYTHPWPFPDHRDSHFFYKTLNGYFSTVTLISSNFHLSESLSSSLVRGTIR